MRRRERKSRKQGKHNHKYHSNKGRNNEQKGYANAGRAWAQLHRRRVYGVEGEAAMLGAKAARGRGAWRQSKELDIR